MLQRIGFLLFLMGAFSLKAAVNSSYTSVLDKLVGRWPVSSFTMSELDGKSVQLRVFETPGNGDYIGTELDMMIKAPIETVEKVLDDVDHYKDLLPGFGEIKKTEVSANQYDVFWEKIIPVFFVKNVKYTVSFTTDKSKPDRKIYRGQLKEEKGLKALDSLVVIEKKEGGTRYYEVAFFDGDFGIISSLAPMKIWRESVEAVLHGALAKKMKSEKPEMKYEDIMTEVEKDVKTYPVETLVEKKKPHPDLAQPVG